MQLVLAEHAPDLVLVDALGLRHGEVQLQAAFVAEYPDYCDP